MTYFETTGPIGDSDVKIRVEGPETPGQHIHMELQSRAEEIRQIVEEGVDPEDVEPEVSIKWSDVLEES